MPNWAIQDLHVIGAKPAVDRFVRTGFVRARKRRSDDVIDFRRVCPLGRRDPKDTYTHESGVVVSSFRTRTQALFSFITSWDYPAAFYERLPRHWPDLSFFCSVNEDMGSFGGVIAVVGGQVHNLVHDYDVDYDRRQHARDVRALLKRWEAHAFGGRDWKLVALAAWEHRYMPFDAQFDDLFWFFFRTREEMAAFRNRYRTRYVMRRVRTVAAYEAATAWFRRGLTCASPGRAEGVRESSSDRQTEARTPAIQAGAFDADRASCPRARFRVTAQ